MFDFEDYWWTIAVLALVASWVMCIVIPVRLVSAPLQITQHYANLDDDSTQDVPPPPQKPGIALPVLTFLASLGIVALSVRKRIVEPEGGNRWVWMACAACLSGFIALLLLAFALRIAARVT